MQEQVIVMSAEQYFKKYAVDGIGKGADRWMIRRQLIDAFRKEIFGLVTLRTKRQFEDIPPEGDPEASRIAKNIIHDATRKWIKLCGMFARYQETANLINEHDLKLYDEIEEIGTTTEDLAEVQEAEDAGDGGEEGLVDSESGEDSGADGETDKSAE